MSRVFVVQNTQRMNEKTGALEAKFDMTSAERFGTLTYLLSPTARPFTPGPIIKQLHEKLEDFTDDDFLLLIGNPCLIGFVVAIASSYNQGRVSVLQWDGRKREYVSVKAVLGGRCTAPSDFAEDALCNNLIPCDRHKI